MQLQTAQRKNAKIRLSLQGPSGLGKTMSALLIAFGITQDWSKISVIDTENRSSELYSHLGPFPNRPNRSRTCFRLNMRSVFMVNCMTSPAMKP